MVDECLAGEGCPRPAGRRNKMVEAAELLLGLLWHGDGQQTSKQQREAELTCDWAAPAEEEQDIAGKV